MRFIRFLLLSILILFLAPFETDASFGLKIDPCYIQELGEEVLCGTYEVMENRNVRKGAKIRLNFIILPAWTLDPAPDPVFIFSGGPGQGSADTVIHYARRYEKLRWERDIVLVDQRGTGQSNRLFCERIGDPDSAQTYLKDMFPEDYIKNCRKDLEKKANLRHYDSTTAMQDIDDLRSALGYEQVNIIGASYGSYAGIVYMKNFPERVRTAFLSYIAMPSWTYSGCIAPNTEAALERLLSDCAMDPDCASDYPLLRQQLDMVLDRLQQGPVTVWIINPITGEYEQVVFTYNNFIHGIRSMLYDSSTSRWIPVFIHWAFQGHFAPVAAYTADYLYWVNQNIMDGMFLCVTCTETIPYIDYEEARVLAQGTFMGTYRLEQQKNACDWWVRGEHPADFHQMYVMDIPTFILSGEIDPVTPPQYGEELASYLPNSLHVVIPNAGHEYGTVWTDCLDDVIAQFISQRSVDGLDTSCVNRHVRPPFVSWKEYETNNSERLTRDLKSLVKSKRQKNAKLNSLHK
jgi:pimeloyl-ACP methyl ester carboxylesterase